MGQVEGESRHSNLFLVYCASLGIYIQPCLSPHISTVTHKSQGFISSGMVQAHFLWGPQ